MIGIVSYGLGNVRAIANMYERLRVPVKLISDSRDFDDVTGVVLPGVGAFDWAMKALTDSNLVDPLVDAVETRNLPLLGICVGMQMLATNSDEGERGGMNWIPGRVRSLDLLPHHHDVRLPHMGWNDVVATVDHELFNDLNSNARFYFLHSYYFDAEFSQNVLAKTSYGSAFPCAVVNGNVIGVQFHPEKSHSWGAKLLGNFAKISRC